MIGCRQPALTMFGILRKMPLPRGKERLGIYLERFCSATGLSCAGTQTIRMNKGHLLKVDIADVIGRHAFIHGEADDYLQACAEQFISRDSIVFDIGANIGTWSVPLGCFLKSRGGGKVYAFEPVRNNYDRLRDNIHLNGLNSIVLPYELALGDTTKKVPMSIENAATRSGNAGLAIQQRAGSAAIEADMTTVDAFLREAQLKRIDLIKIAIEGSEGLFMDGAGDLFREFRPVVIGFFSRLGLTRYGSSISLINERFGGLGYKGFTFERKKKLVSFDPANDAGTPLLFLPESAEKRIISRVCVTKS